MMRLPSALLVGCLLTAVSGLAAAQDPAAAPPSAPMGALGGGFGDAGQLVISSQMLTEFVKANNAGWVFAIQPAIDYFIVSSVSIGGVVRVELGDNDHRVLVVGGRAGYNLNVTEHVSVWGRAGVSYRNDKLAVGSASFTYLNLHVPVVYHIVPHLFFGLGPFYDAKLSGNASNVYGFFSMVGGWW
jgi:hypothetical protein